MKSNRFDLLLLAMLVATLAIGGLFVLYRNHELLHDAPPMELRIDSAKTVTPSPAKTTVVLPQPEHAAQEAIDAPPVNVALVTADWCGACQSFKRDVMPLLRERFDEKQIAIREVDLDRQADEARALLADGEQSIPQLVVYQCPQPADGDPGACSAVQPLKRLVGKHSAGEVKEFLLGKPEEKPEVRSQKSEVLPAAPTRRRLFRRQ